MPKPRTLLFPAAIALLPLLAAAAQTGDGSEPGQSQQATPPSGTGSTAGSAVIRPPEGVDPGINKAQPPGQTYPMPVVRPPGTPGGDATVIPK
jgi:hypothetical protein